MPKLATTIALLLALVAASPRARAAEATAADLTVHAERAPSPFRALVPGLVQLDRGEKVKGWTVIGLEAALLATALEFQLSSGALQGQAQAELRGGSFTVGQRLAEQSAQRARLRDGFLVAAATLWVLSLVDARLSPPHASREGAALADRPLMPIASIARRGVVAGVSLKF